MKRLTMCIDNHFYYSDNGKPIIPIEILDTPKVREVLKSLCEYEDIGLTPDVIKYKLEETQKAYERYIWHIENYPKKLEVLKKYIENLRGQSRDAIYECACNDILDEILELGF